ncbi:MAG: YbaB/EbfC family nucleoid-associated protein [Magnetospirillum sp. WYHS-4]
MKNLGQMMKQAQQLQSRMTQFQQDMTLIEAEGSAGGGMVKVRVSGKGELRGLKIDPALMAPGEAEVLEDLIVAAHNDARTKVESEVAKKMAEVTGGLQLPPGFQLPF